MKRLSTTWAIAADSFCMTSTSEVALNSSLPKQEAQVASLCNSSAEAKNGQLNILPSHRMLRHGASELQL